MNKLFKSATLIALVAFGAIATQSCKKGEEDPGLSLRGRDGRLSGTWMMTSMNMTEEDMTEYVDQDPANDGDIEKRESSSTSTWDGTNYTMTETEMWLWDDGSSYDSEETWTGGNITEKTTSDDGDGNSSTSEVEGTYTANWEAEYTFEKDGTFSMTMTRSTTTDVNDDDEDGAYDLNITTSESETYTVSGIWSWLGENKSAEIADKERVALWYTSETIVSESEEEEDYTDTDSGDFIDWDEDDVSESSESTSTWTGNNTDEPDEVWSLVRLANDEMNVVIEGNYSNEYESISRYSDFFGNSTSEDEYTSTGSYKNEASFEKQ